MSEWHLYLVRTADGSLYAGITTDVERRLAEHRDGKARGSRFLRGRGPLELVYSQPVGDRAMALRAENRVKQLSKSRKEEVIRVAPSGEELLAMLALEIE